MTGSSTQGIKTVLHPVSDLATAKAVYTALLGVPPQTDGPYYVGFEAEGQHIGLVPGGGPQGMTSPVAYWHVPDIEAKLAEVTAAGAAVKEPVRDVGGGRRWPLSPTPMATSSGCFRTDECRPPAPALSVVATPSFGSPTTSMWVASAWRTVRRLWCRCTSTGTASRCWWPRPTDSPTGRNLAPTRTVRLGWATPATCRPRRRLRAAAGQRRRRRPGADRAVVRGSRLRLPRSRGQPDPHQRTALSRPAIPEFRSVGVPECPRGRR